MKSVIFGDPCLRMSKRSRSFTFGKGSRLRLMTILTFMADDGVEYILTFYDADGLENVAVGEIP